jgi:ABC-2 type transport system permease protein
VRGFAAFWGKEWRETWRSGRFFILTAVFLLLGISSPLAYKFLPQLIPAELAEAFSSLLNPTTSEVIVSLFKNLSQLGILVLILLAMGAVVEEKSRGQLELILARPVSTTSVIWAKFAVWALQLALALVVVLGSFTLYTHSLFPPGPSLLALLQGGLLYYLYCLLVLAFTLLASTLLPTSLLAALLSGGVFLALSFLPNLGPAYSLFAPPSLLEGASRVAIGASLWGIWWESAAVTASLILLANLLAVWALRQQDI